MNVQRLDASPRSDLGHFASRALKAPVEAGLAGDEHQLPGMRLIQLAALAPRKPPALQMVSLAALSQEGHELSQWPHVRMAS